MRLCICSLVPKFSPEDEQHEMVLLVFRGKPGSKVSAFLGMKPHHYSGLTLAHCASASGDVSDSSAMMAPSTCRANIRVFREVTTGTPRERGSRGMEGERRAGGGGGQFYSQLSFTYQLQYQCPQSSAEYQTRHQMPGPLELPRVSQRTC